MFTTQQNQEDPFRINYINMQLSFSTADVEKSLFYSPEYNSVRYNQPVGNINMIAVNGQLYLLQEESPTPSIPFTEESGLFQIINLDKHD